jgi:hypothetical protein
MSTSIASVRQCKIDYVGNAYSEQMVCTERHQFGFRERTKKSLLPCNPMRQPIYILQHIPPVSDISRLICAALVLFDPESTVLEQHQHFVLAKL